jgi:hypothetical protein
MSDNIIQFPLSARTDEDEKATSRLYSSFVSLYVNDKHQTKPQSVANAALAAINFIGFALADGGCKLDTEMRTALLSALDEKIEQANSLNGVFDKLADK